MFYSKNKVPDGPNYTGYFNKDFDRLFESSYYENDPKKRFLLYQKMDRMVIEYANVVPILYDQSIVMTQNNISGYPLNPLNLMILKTVKKK
ncbi:Dipeptide-binding protein DppE precursor [compost metagenome]